MVCYGTSSTYGSTDSDTATSEAYMCSFTPGKTGSYFINSPYFQAGKSVKIDIESATNRD